MFPNDISQSEVSPSLSRFIAGLIGPVLAAIAISLLFNRDLASQIAAEIPQSKGLIILSGVSLLVAGLAVIQCHATWRGWPAIVTALGCLSIVSGLARILFPAQLASIATDLSTPSVVMVGAPVALAIGLYLSFKAYV